MLANQEEFLKSEYLFNFQKMDCYNKVLENLELAFRANLKAKAFYSPYSQEEYYKEKSKYIRSAIDGIKIGKLRIKHGLGVDDFGRPVYYFETQGKQISFHMQYDRRFNRSNCKKFHGEWCGIRNDYFPFTIKRD